MKVVILAGGYGTRLSEETSVRPKPMVEIGGMPILWHIMKIYSYHGLKEFVICCGYKSSLIKAFFANYLLNSCDVVFDLEQNKMQIQNGAVEPWRVTLVETGVDTMTGGRLKRVKSYLDDETFCFTYGDGVSDINIGDLIRFHKRQGSKATMTAVQPPGRFGAFDLRGDSNLIESFREKPQGDGAWINGGFFVLEPETLDYIESNASVWEREPLERLAREGELSAFRHVGFWQPMDTVRDKMVLDEMWKSGSAPWKVWKDDILTRGAYGPKPTKQWELDGLGTPDQTNSVGLRSSH